MLCCLAGSAQEAPPEPDLRIVVFNARMDAYYLKKRVDSLQTVLQAAITYLDGVSGEVKDLRHWRDSANEAIKDLPHFQFVAPGSTLQLDDIIDPGFIYHLPRNSPDTVQSYRGIIFSGSNDSISINWHQVPRLYRHRPKHPIAGDMVEPSPHHLELFTGTDWKLLTEQP